MPASPSVREPSLRSMMPSVFLPAMVYEIGNGAIAPIIALTALDDGASPATAGFMLALLGLGQILGDVPASTLADRVGDRRAMMLAAGLAVIGLLGCALASSLAVLGAALLVIGMSNSTFYLARQSYLSEVAPTPMRALAMSTLGGSHRIGLFLGPLLGALVISLTSMRAAYVLAMVAATSAAVLLLVVPDVDVPQERRQPARGSVTTTRMVAEHHRLFATLGIAVLAVGAVRAARQTVLPLWAQHLGLSPEQTSLVFGIASAVDMALFYPSGKVMDRRGRLAVAVPSMVILGAAMMVLPLTTGIVSLTLVAMMMSFGNGIGAGIMMTLGADTAPAVGRTKFLGVWRLLSDSGNALGPVVVALLATAATLSLGIVAIGTSGLFAAGALCVWVPRYSAFAVIRRPGPRRRPDRRNGIEAHDPGAGAAP